MSVIIDSYSDSNRSAINGLGDAAYTGQGISFAGNGAQLSDVIFYLGKYGSPTGNITAKIYAISGTYGSNDNIPTGSALATSDVFDSATISATYPSSTGVTFSFTGANQITLSAGSYYVVTIEKALGNNSNFVTVDSDLSSPTAIGNTSQLVSGTWATYTRDLCFVVNGITAVAPTVTTQAVSEIVSTTATGNGNVISDGGATVTERGVCIGASANPTTGDTKFSTSGTTGVYTVSMTGLTRPTTYHVRTYAINSVGTSYGSDVNFTTLGFTNPANIYSSNNTYATLAATSGILTVEVSKDAGANWQTPKTVTFTASDTLQTCGTGATELWGSSFTRADMVDATFRVRLSQGGISQVYKTFGFVTDTDILTGIEIAIEGKYASSTLSLDLLEVKAHYGSSVLPVQAGSQAYASNGRKAGEGAGSGTGVLVYYDGSEWIASDTGATVAA